jgi:pimeloyl-ACP methyl ester carboxylesterase
MDVTIDSPLAAGESRIHVRVEGERAEDARAPIVHLHGGWGYEIYPLPALGRRVLVPDRTGYGRSTPIAELPPHFHRAAAGETEHLLAELGVERPVVWGHSDGAVIAAILALRDPARYRGVVLEALHVDREKPASRQFFTDMADYPTRFGPRVAAILERDHGARWQDVLRMGGRAWLRIAATPDEDFFGGRLGELSEHVPTLVVHGADDPRTEPDELARIRRALPHARYEIVDGGGHCPHAHPRCADAVARAVVDFVDGLP